MRIHIGIPTHDGKLYRECVIGLLSAWSRIPMTINVVQGSFLPRSRDRIVRDFAADKASTHLLCLDSDIDWAYRHLVFLLELETDFAFGLYVAKNPERMLCAARKLSSEVRDFQTGKDVQVERYDRCGAGFVLLSRSCVERMLEAYRAEETYDFLGESFVGLWQTNGRSELDGKVVAEGEDFAFCRRWRALGGEILTRRDVSLGHVGSHVYRP
jgi:hypothetical protein